jgi:hypothetical protein
MSVRAVSDALNAMLADDAARERIQAGDTSGFDLDSHERDLVCAAAGDLTDASEVAAFCASGQHLPFDFLGPTDFAYQSGGHGHSSLDQAALYCRGSGGGAGKV